jgi:hypothetical protein
MSIDPKFYYQDIFGGLDLFEAGTDALSGISMPPRNGRPVPVYGQPYTGAFNTPGSVLDEMLQLDVSFNALDTDMKTNITRQVVLDAWNNFLAQWKKFFSDHQSFTSRLSAGAVSNQVHSYKDQLASFYKTYERETSLIPTMKAPPTTSEAATQKKQDDADKPNLIPWWVWAAGVGGVALAGFAVYKTIQEAREIRKEILPHVAPIAAHAAMKGLL